MSKTATPNAALPIQTTSDGWLGPYSSGDNGDTVILNHRCSRGDKIIFRVKDVHGAEGYGTVITMSTDTDYTASIINQIEEDDNDDPDDDENQRAVKNSTIIAFTSAVFATALGTMAGYGLARFKFWKIRNADLTIWFLSQRVLPPVVVAIPFFLLAKQFQALDKVSTLIILNTTFNLPFAVIIMSQLFKELPIELEQAALVDGYSRIGAFFKVALPLSTPGLVATAIICLAFAWNEFMFALIMAQKNAITLPYIISGASDTRGIQFWFIATRALMAMVPPTILALTVQRFIVRGLTFGAVKG